MKFRNQLFRRVIILFQQVTNKKQFVFFLYLSLILLSISAPSVHAGYPGSEDAVVKAVERVEPAVVNIKTVWVSNQGTAREGTGSGVIISGSGWIITNAHVIRNAKKIYVTLNDGRVFSATNWRANPREDIAVVKIAPEKLPVAPLANSLNLKKGQIAIAIGNPWKFRSTVTVGCVSGFGRNVSAGNSGYEVRYKDLIQTDAAINPGNSGGALVNSRGEVIGINTLVFTGAQGSFAQGLSFAIPIDHTMEIAREMMQNKEGPKVKPWLGVHVRNVSPEMKLGVKSGVIVVRFPPESPARDSGLRPGDIVLGINQVPITSVRDMQNVINRLNPGDVIIINVLRGRQRYNIKVKLEGMRQ